MKYLALIAVLLAAIFFVASRFQKEPPIENAEIRLHIEGLSYNWIYLQDVHENVKSKLDSTLVDAEGRAAFVYGQALDPGYYTIELPDDVSIPILLDRDQTFTLESRLDQLIGDMRVSGSQENTLLYDNLQFDIDLQERFQAEIRQIQDQGEQQLDQDLINRLRQKYFAEKDDFIHKLFRKHPHTLFTKFEKAKLAPEALSAILADPNMDEASRRDKVLSHFWDNVDFSDDRLLRTPVIFDKLWQYMNEFVPDQTGIKVQAIDRLMEKAIDHPNYYRFFARWISDDYMPPYTGQMDPDALYIHMVDRYLTEERAFWADSTQLYAWQLRASDRRVSLAGMKGGNFEAKDPNGQSRALYDVTSPYIALFFYHYDCDHCVETTPKLVQQYRALKDQGLEVVAVAMDTPDAEWKDFIRKNDMDWINVSDQDNEEIYDHYFVRATPEITLLNPDRVIIGRHLAVDDLPIMMQMDKEGMLKNGLTSLVSK